MRLRIVAGKPGNLEAAFDCADGCWERNWGSYEVCLPYWDLTWSMFCVAWGGAPYGLPEGAA
jgi:hypothetical protein